MANAINQDIAAISTEVIYSPTVDSQEITAIKAEAMYTTVTSPQLGAIKMEVLYLLPRRRPLYISQTGK